MRRCAGRGTLSAAVPLALGDTLRLTGAPATVAIAELYADIEDLRAEAAEARAAA